MRVFRNSFFFVLGFSLAALLLPVPYMSVTAFQVDRVEAARW